MDSQTPRLACHIESIFYSEAEPRAWNPQPGREHNVPAQQTREKKGLARAKYHIPKTSLLGRTLANLTRQSPDSLLSKPKPVAQLIAARNC